MEVSYHSFPSGKLYTYVLDNSKPVWLSSYKYKDKVYRFLVNARTGEVQGDRPYSAIKIALLVISIVAVVGIIIYFASQKQ